MFKRKLAIIATVCILLISMTSCATGNNNANTGTAGNADLVSSEVADENNLGKDGKKNPNRKDEKKDTASRTTPAPSKRPSDNEQDVEVLKSTPPNITQIEYSSESSLFLDSKGNVYTAGLDVIDKNKEYYSATRIFKNAVDISIAQLGRDNGNGEFYLNLILTKSGVCYAKGVAPNGEEYLEYSKIMKNVKDVAPGLFLKKNGNLYISGMYSDANDPEKSLDSYEVEKPVLLLEDVVDFKGSFEHGMALNSFGELFIWGEYSVNGALHNYGFVPTMVASDVKKIGDAEGVFWFVDDSDILYEIPNDHHDGIVIKIVEDAKEYCTSKIYIGTDDTLYVLENGSQSVVAEDVKQAFFDGKIYYINNSGEFCSAEENPDFTVDNEEEPYNVTVYFDEAVKVLSYNGPVFVKTKSKVVYTWGSNEMYSMGIGRHETVGGEIGSPNNPEKVKFK